MPNPNVANPNPDREGHRISKTVEVPPETGNRCPHSRTSQTKSITFSNSVEKPKKGVDPGHWRQGRSPPGSRSYGLVRSGDPQTDAPLRADIREIFTSLENHILHCFHKYEVSLLYQIAEMREAEATLKKENSRLSSALQSNMGAARGFQNGTARVIGAIGEDSPLYGSEEATDFYIEGSWSDASAGSAFVLDASEDMLGRFKPAADELDQSECLEQESALPKPKMLQVRQSQGKSETGMETDDSMPSTINRTVAESEDFGREKEQGKTGSGSAGLSSSEVRPSAINAVRSTKSKRDSLTSMRSGTKTLYGAAEYELLPLWQEVALKEEQGGSLRITSNRNQASARSSAQILEKKIRPKHSSFTKEALDNMFLNPTSQNRILWELIGSILIVYDVIMLPLQLVFIMPWRDFRSIMRWITGIYWLLDVPSSFFLGYYVDGVLELRFTRMAKNYLTTWFVPDIVLVALDWVYLLSGQGQDGDDEGSKALEAGRSLRMLRLIRLLRLLKLNLFVNRMLEQITSEQIIIMTDVVKLIIFIVIITHIFACGWYGISVNPPGKTWVKVNFEESDDIGYRYSTSLHWALTQFTPASMEVVPKNTSERIYNVWVLLCALVTFSSFISSITEAMNNLRKINSQQTQLYMQLRSYLRDNRVSKNLSARVWRYLKRTTRMRQKRKGWQDVAIFKDMPETLQAELKVEVYAPICMACPFFTHYNECSQAAMRAICFKATHEINNIAGQDLFSPGQVAYGMFFVIEGTLEYYLPDDQLLDEPPQLHLVTKTNWISEAAVWLRWLHPGSMVPKTDAALLVLEVTVLHTLFKQYIETLWNCYSYAGLFLELAKNQETAVTDLGFDFDALTDIAYMAFNDDASVLQPSSSDGMSETRTVDSRYTVESIKDWVGRNLSMKSIGSFTSKLRRLMTKESSP